MANIKRFFEYNDSNIDYRGFNSIGEFIEANIKDSYVKSLSDYYIKDIGSDVRVSNAINTMSNIDLNYLYKKVCDYLDGIESSDEVEVIATNESSDLVAGKNIFKSFLRMLAALGLKENKPDWINTPSDFLIYYQFDDLQYDNIKMMMSRFKSLVPFIERLEPNNGQKLYFGVKGDLTFEYGIYVTEHSFIGKFKMNRSNYNWLMTLDTTASSSLKRELADMDIVKIKLFGAIKKDMASFNPGKYKTKTVPTIKDDVITFAYHGIGRWDSGEVNQEDLNNLRQNFKTWASKLKWSYQCQMNVIANDFWIQYQIKLN